MTHGSRGAMEALTRHTHPAAEAAAGTSAIPSNGPDEGDCPVLLLRGDSGCGKTSVLANWIHRTQKANPHLPIVTHYVGSSALSTDLPSALRRITAELEALRGGGTTARGKIGDPPMEALHRAANAGPCVVILDGCDQLEVCHQTPHQPPR